MLWNLVSVGQLVQKVLEEVWKKRKQSVKHLSVFGSLCYIHVPGVRSKRLDDKSEPMILVGYHKRVLIDYTTQLNMYS